MNIQKVSNKIINVIKSMINEQIIICNRDGIIIASTNRSRIGNFHEGAAIVVEKKSDLVITQKSAKTLKGVKPGINLPILFHRKVIGVIGITGDIEKVKPLAEIVRKMTELLINENYYNEQLEFEHRALENFVFEWIHEGETSELLKDRAETFGIDLKSDKQVILMEINIEDSSIQKQIWNYIDDLLGDRDTLIRWGYNRYVWIHSIKSDNKIKKSFLKFIKENCEKHFHVCMNIGVGNGLSADKINKSYKQARVALKYSKLYDGIAYHNELKLELCLQEIPKETKQMFINRTIRVILDQPQLLKTLKCFLREDLSPQKAAEQLFIHVNTLHYRLSRIEQLTGLNPKNLQDVIKLYLALAFLEDSTTFNKFNE